MSYVIAESSRDKEDVRYKKNFGETFPQSVDLYVLRVLHPPQKCRPQCADHFDDWPFFPFPTLSMLIRRISKAKTDTPKIRCFSDLDPPKKEGKIHGRVNEIAPKLMKLLRFEFSRQKSKGSNCRICRLPTVLLLKAK